MIVMPVAFHIFCYYYFFLIFEKKKILMRARLCGVEMSTDQ